MVAQSRGVGGPLFARTQRGHPIGRGGHRRGVGGDGRVAVAGRRVHRRQTQLHLVGQEG